MVTNIIIINDKGSFKIRVIFYFIIALDVDDDTHTHTLTFCVYNIFSNNMQRN